MTTPTLTEETGSATFTQERIATVSVGAPTGQIVFSQEGLASSATDTGLIGPPGPEGPQGLQGPPGPSGGATVSHSQTTPAATWIVEHNLARYPSIVVLDATGQELIADVHHTSNNSVSVVFAEPTVGFVHVGT